MFKLIVLTALFALAAAKPSYLHAPALISPAVTKIVQPPPVVYSTPEHVGSVVSSIPTGVSAHSSSVVHSTGAVVTPVITPVHKTVVAAPVVHAAPIVHAPIVHKTYAAPLAYHSYAAHAAPLAYTSYHAPLAYSSYGAYAGHSLW